MNNKALEALIIEWRNRPHAEYVDTQIAFQKGVEWAADKLKAALSNNKGAKL